MNVTLQTNKFNPQYNNYKPSNGKKLNTGITYNQPSFTSIGDVPAKSGLLNPFKRMGNKISTWIARNYTTRVYTSKLADFMAGKAEKLDSVVDHMQVAGSIIISGMYMLQTIRNKDLDEDRRRTLAVNQGLTFLISTFGSYLIDRRLDGWWENVTTKYAEKQTGDKDLGKKIKAINDDIIAKFEKEYGKKPPKGKSPKLVKTLKYVEDHCPDALLETKLRGMGVLKKLVVFGTVYRFLAPVLVTPFANVIGDKLVSHNNKKADNQTKKA